jgi:hypothetical protein
MKMIVFWVVAPCSLVEVYRRFQMCLLSPSYPHIIPPIRAVVLMMEAVCTSKTSVNFYQTTRRYNPEDSHLHTEHEWLYKWVYLIYLATLNQVL